MSNPDTPDTRWTPGSPWYVSVVVGTLTLSEGGVIQPLRSVLRFPLFYARFLMYLQQQKLESEGTLDAITLAFRSGQTDYSVSELGIPGLRHFVYKSRAHVQVTVPVFEDPYDDIQERRRCILSHAIASSIPASIVLIFVRCRVTTLYQILHDSIHGKSGQDGALKLQYIRTEKESVMGWVCRLFSSDY
jgi:hypothetical protein